MCSTTDSSATALGALLCFVWGAFFLGWLVHKSRIVSDTVSWFRKSSTPRRIAVVLVVAGLVAYGGSKENGTMQSPRPPLLQHVEEQPADPSFAPVSICTNDVVFRAETTNAAELTAFRRIGGTELGEWIEADAPFFSIGTNPVSRCYVAASGSVSFESMRRPPVGAPLPDGTGLPVLCPLRAPLGMVPEANWAVAGALSRFWHKTLPGGGRVLTWENALVDRLPGRRVSLQVELQPSGDGVFRYDFHDALDPPATNFVMGAQMGTNGVNALSILGTNVLSATVWNVGGTPVTNGVSIADLLCTNGVLRTPAAFEIRWKNTTGVDPDADTDGDGLTDWAETFLWGTDRNHADTDGDGIADNVELMMDADPFDADEDGNGVPDGVSEEEWLANPLWAANGNANVTITLQEAIPTNATATLLLGDIAIPLRNLSSWNFCLPVGETIHGRLFSEGVDIVKLSVSPVDNTSPARMLRGTSSTDAPRIRDDPCGVLDGNSNNGTFRIAIPEIVICNLDGTRAVSECVHDSEGVRQYTVQFSPDDWGLSLGDTSIEGFDQMGNGILQLSVGPNPYDQALGRVRLMKCLDYGTVEDTVLLWRCSMSAAEPYPVELLVDVGMAATNAVKRILPRHSVHPPGRPTMACRLRLTGRTEHAPTFHISGTKLKFGPDAKDSLTVTVDGSNVYDFVISGEIASTAMNDAEIIVRRDGPTGPICATGAVTVVWVDPITIRTGKRDPFSADNASLVKPQPSYLGTHCVSFGQAFDDAVGYVVEIKGAVHPASAPPEFKFRRDNISAYYALQYPGGNMNVLQDDTIILPNTSFAFDAMHEKLQDLDPSPNGFIYDIDTPGFDYADFKHLPTGTRGFARAIFVQYVTVGGRRCSDDFYWHVRLTAIKGTTSSPNTIGALTRPGHPDDNEAGAGGTTPQMD